MTAIGNALLVPALNQHYGAAALVDLEAMLVATLGSSLAHFWVPRASSVTLSGSTVMTLADLKGSAPFAYESGVPLWLGTGGPGGQPCIHLSTSTSLLTSVGCDRAAGHRQAIYAVGALTGSGGDEPLVIRRESDSSVSSARALIGQSGTGKFRGYCVFTGGAQDVNSTVAADTAWHLFALKPLASGASMQRDGVEFSPTFSGNDTVQALGSANIGHYSASGGKLAALLFIEAPTTDQDAAIRAYVAQRFGLSV